MPVLGYVPPRLFLCFTEKTEYLPLLRANAIRKFGHHRKDTATLPSMKCVPARYSPQEIKCHIRLTLIGHDSARQAGIAVYGNISTMEQLPLEMASQKVKQ